MGPLLIIGGGGPGGLPASQSPHACHVLVPITWGSCGTSQAASMEKALNEPQGCP